MFTEGNKKNCFPIPSTSIAQEDKEHDFGSDLHLLQRQLVREKSMKAGLKVTEDETVKMSGQMGWLG